MPVESRRSPARQPLPDPIAGLLPRLFIALALLVGTAYVVLIPPVQVPDEAGHLFRAWSVSHAQWVPKPLAPISNRIRELDRWFMPRSEISPDNIGQLRPENIWTALRIPYGEADAGCSANINQNVMSPVPYLASGVALALGRQFPVSALAMMYLARFCNLLAFIGIVFAALRLLPAFRPIFFAVAMMPMTLALGASLSADALTTALAMLLFAYVLRLSLDPEIKALGRRHYITLAVLILLNALCKSDAILALLVLTIPRDKLPRTRGAWWLAPAALIVFAFAIVGAWQWLDRENHIAYAAARLPDIDVHANLSFLYKHPAAWSMALVRTAAVQWEFYARLFVGSLGYYAVWLPRPLILGYPLFLIVVAMSQKPPAALSLRQKAIMVAAALASVGAVFVLLWEHETTRAMLRAVAEWRGIFPSVAGRYFIPFAPLLLVPLASRRMDGLPARAVTLATIAVVTASNVLGIVYSWNTYYRLAPHQPPAALSAAPARTQVGTFRDGLWHLDSDGDRMVDHFGKDAVLAFGGLPGDRPIVGDWNGDGVSRIGVYRNGVWLLDSNGNGRFDGEGPGQDRVCRLGGMDGDVPVAGDWTGAGRDSIGVFRHGLWLLDETGACASRGGAVEKTRVLSFGGPGDVPVVGDWNGDGRTNLGIVRDGFLWFLDSNENGTLDAGDRSMPFGGIPGDVPIVGDWDGSGRSDIGVFRRGMWILNGPACGPGGSDPKCTFSYGGIPGDLPVVGQWRLPGGRFERKVVRRAGDSAEDRKVYFVRGGRRHWIIDGAWMERHGFQWQHDVLVIEAGELKRIPLGYPLR